MKGQTLIEVLVALSISVFVVSGTTIAVISALNNAQFSKNQNLATQHAQEGMEFLRNLRNNDWGTFRESLGSFCLGKGSTALERKLSLDCPQNVDNFIRQIDIKTDEAPCLGDQVKATVYVGWADGKCISRTDYFCHKVKLSTCFSKSEVIPSP